MAGLQSSVELSGLLLAFYEDMGSPEAGPGRWRATGALAGEGG